MLLHRCLIRISATFLTISVVACGAPRKNEDAGPTPKKCELSPISFEDLRASGRDFTQDYNFQLALTPKDCPNDSPIKCEGISEADYPYINDFYLKMRSELELYPKELIALTRLKILVFTDKLAASNLGNNGASGMTINPNNGSGIAMLINVSSLRTCDAKIYRRIFHHEMGHVLDGGLNSPGQVSSSKEWAQMNPTDFTYGKNYGTVTPDWLSMNHPMPGLISKYGTVSPAEDFAEFFSVMHVEQKGEDLKKWLDADTNLKKKLTYMLVALGLKSKVGLQNLPNYAVIREQLVKP